VEGVTVEIIGNPQYRRADGTWEAPADWLPHKHVIEVAGMEVPVLALVYEYDAYLKLGRTKKVTLLERWLRESNHSATRSLEGNESDVRRRSPWRSSVSLPTRRQGVRILSETAALTGSDLYSGANVGKVDEYRTRLKATADWEPYLLRESRLPGPRGNLELAEAAAAEGDEELFRHLLSFDANRAPTNTPHEFLFFCGVLGLGRLLAEGRLDVLGSLRQCASDSRWRAREAVASALMRLGEVDMASLLREMKKWSSGKLLEKRAAAAALSHPGLLGDAKHAKEVLRILDDITSSIDHVRDRRSDEFRALRKGLGYCWSVAVAALPAEGKRRMERWFASGDPDVGWVMRQNLGKKRLARMDAEWVERWKQELASRARAG
jgi:hypothetical protein